MKSPFILKFVDVNFDVSDPLDLFRHQFKPYVRIGPRHQQAKGSTMMERAESLVPVLRAKPPYGARGSFSFDPIFPHLDHIILPPNINEIEENIVLAHEIGHVENSRFERERWMKTIPEIMQWRFMGKRPDIDIIIEEERRANERGAVHIRELRPDLIELYAYEMADAIDIVKRQLERLAP